MRENFLKILLLLGAAFYLVGAIVHYFGLTLFPWFDGTLYSPYHDSIIAMASLAISGFFFVTYLDPNKNLGNLRVIIIAALISGILTIVMAYKTDFVSLYGSTLKNSQAWVEGVSLIIFSFLIFILKPNKNS
ncbi:MAG: hypothetical protein A3B23_01900 [Candidatus Colwellbacteria bacterium RIFCSPLOWO2_01_FULL_48_10]|uniref:Uncharacterized protein n=1 Tax=Candidatus Colwellbacteria bacterium RIFCSPLOWO2_01_FULL_48_10 TaxID=1797690 RepID=A0A1G1Z969_9BACT|nr:MAG: hypothetical protein A3B23_01900 [Candidatus Colwellbacteria bacterium RIFCSPLOWO2_01_FULL_48_10]